jgi:hypothetical protein
MATIGWPLVARQPTGPSHRLQTVPGLPALRSDGTTSLAPGTMVIHLSLAVNPELCRVVTRKLKLVQPLELQVIPF